MMDGYGSPIALPGAGTLSAPRPGMPMAGNLNAAETAARQTFAQSMPPQIVTQILTKDDAHKNIGLLASGISPNSPFMQGDSEVRRASGPESGEGDVVPAGGPPMMGPGPAGLSGPVPPIGSGLPGAVAAIGALRDGPGPFCASRTSVRFAGPNGMKVQWYVPEGGALAKGAKIATISARARAILSGERVALNFLQHLSGVATLARAFAKAVEGTGVTILDTRKTTPGLRFLEKHAVRVGGAGNHRFGLFDGVLIKENHIRAAGGMKAAFERTRAGSEGLPTVIEAKSPEEALDAADLHPTRVLLDNFTPSAIATTVRRLKGSKVEIEVSGGIRLANVRDFAIPGVNYISVGSITHSAPALDMSLLMDEVEAGA